MAGSMRRWEQGSGSIARDRLETVLMGDRLGCSPEMLERMKRDILAVMEKYVDCRQFQITVYLEPAAQEKQEENHVKTIQIKGL